MDAKLRFLGLASCFMAGLVLVFPLLSGEEAEKDKFIQIILPNGNLIRAELAKTNEERARGLMYREGIASDQGMLFIFEEEEIHSFWMKNMSFPIDIIWLDEGKRIVHMEINVPPCKEMPCPTYASKIPSLYVLELKAGCVESNGLKLYDRLEFILPAE